MTDDLTQVRTPDGRTLEVLVTGSGGRDGVDTLLFHNGTPSGTVDFAPLARVAAGSALRVVTYARPGYGTSSPDLGRSVAAVAGDVTAVLDSLDVDAFVVLGMSGGGPHALATAALLGERCRAAATLGGVAPYDADGLDWLGGMGAENIAEFAAAAAGIESLTAFLDKVVPGLAAIDAEAVAGGLGDLVDEVDRAAITGELATWLATSMRRAVMHGIAGWRDDDLAFVRPWGFDLDEITIPVGIWQGDHDRMVPKTHGAWLAAHVPGASAHLLADEGHISLINLLDTVVPWLVKAAE